jgi:parallel beta-helix repeat protein
MQEARFACLRWLVAIFLVAGLAITMISCTVQVNKQYNGAASINSSMGFDPALSINGNAQLDAIASSGNGTPANPYIIEDQVFNVSATGLGIEIKNTNASLTIYDCIFYNLGLDENASISLDNVSNANVSYNTIRSNTWEYGQDGIDLNASFNNIIELNNVMQDYLATSISLEGSNFNIIENNSAGSIGLGSSSNDTIANNHNQDLSIGLYQSYNNTVSGNVATVNGNIECTASSNDTITNNSIVQPYWYSMEIVNSSSITVANNTLVTAFYYGIFIETSNSTLLSGNRLTNCSVFVEATDVFGYSSQSIGTSNTVNGRPIYYYANASGLGSGDFINAGQVFLAYCRNMQVGSANVSYGTIGVYLTDSINVTISGVNASYCEYGFEILESNNITVSGCDAFYAGWNGIWVLNSNGTVLTSNNNSLCHYGNIPGIEVDQSSGATILGNYELGEGIALNLDHTNDTYIANNIMVNDSTCVSLSIHDVQDKIVNNTLMGYCYGIYLTNSDDNTISGNNASLQPKGWEGQTGIYLVNSTGAAITENTVNFLETGILLWNSGSSTVSGNIAQNESYTGIQIDNCLDEVVKDNTATGLWYGIDLYGMNDSTIADNDIDWNQDGMQVTSCSNDVIAGNNVSYVQYDGITMLDSTNNSIVNNTACHGCGLVLQNSSDNSIVGNNISYDATTGIYLDQGSDNNLIKGNYLWADGYDTWNDTYYCIVNLGVGNIEQDNVIGGPLSPKDITDETTLIVFTLVLVGLACTMLFLMRLVVKRGPAIFRVETYSERCLVLETTKAVIKELVQQAIGHPVRDPEKAVKTELVASIATSATLFILGPLDMMIGVEEKIAKFYWYLIFFGIGVILLELWVQRGQVRYRRVEINAHDKVIQVETIAKSGSTREETIPFNCISRVTVRREPKDTVDQVGFRVKKARQQRDGIIQAGYDTNMRSEQVSINYSGNPLKGVSDTESYFRTLFPGVEFFVDPGRKARSPRTTSDSNLGKP